MSGNEGERPGSVIFGPTNPPGGAPWPIPPTQAAAHFSVTMTGQELLLTVGVTRVQMQQGPSGNLAPVLGAEWLLSLSMSPSSAKILQNNLSTAIGRYEEVFGNIPFDQTLKTEVTEKGGPGTAS
jgi:hypothetical protein